MSLLEVRDLTIRYGDQAVVDGLSLNLEKGEVVGLVGESGSGKSQTALAIMGLLPASAHIDGSIRIDATEIVGASDRALNALRATRAAMVFQDPLAALNPYLRIGAQLGHILKAHGLASGAAARRRVVQMLARVGLPAPEQQYHAYPHELSGGMRQRVMIAAALLGEPAVLLADEPTTALDVTVQAQVLDLLDELRRETTVLLITHDLGVVAGRCDRVLAIDSGALVESAATPAFFATPQHPYTRKLLAAAQADAAARRAPVEEESALGIEGAAVSYPVRRRAPVMAVREATLDVRAGETVALVGESGSGKSSLVRAVLGLVPLAAGRVVLAGVPLEPELRNRGPATRRDLQLVFQDPVASLDPQMTVAAIIAEPLEVHGMSRSEIDERVRQSLAAVDLAPAFLARHPHELSGGQAQRVAIARALSVRPRVLVCDEAVAALDGRVRARILKLLEAVQAETSLAIVFITHDLSVARTISHRVAVMYLGRIVEVANTAGLFERPRHPYTAALLDAVPRPDPAAPGGKATISGELPSLFSIPQGCVFHPRCRFAIDVCRVESPTLAAAGAALVECHRAAELELDPG